MGVSRGVLALLVGMLILCTRCTRAIAGMAQPDPRKPGTTVRDDGFGILAGFPDAGQLVVTYRPMTFLDEESDG
jgi:hypothetical protein